MPDQLVVPGSGSVSACWLEPAGSGPGLVLGHGAGAGMTHAFMEQLAQALASQGIATLRYQFPYMERGSRRPDPPPVLMATVEAAVAAAAGRWGHRPRFAGGKSMGGRMSSQSAARGLPIRGLVFFGFPLHPARKPGVSRASHLERVAVPMLFLQGDRDALADLSLLEPLVARLGARARLVVFPGADHGFQVLKRSGRTDAEVLAGLAAEAAGWMRSVAESEAPA